MNNIEKNGKNNNMIDCLKDYYSTHSKDEIINDSESTKIFDEKYIDGITVDEFFDELNNRIEKWD